MKRVLSFLINDVGRLSVGGALFVISLIVDTVFGGFPALILYIITYLFVAGGVLYEAARGILRLDFFDERFLMSIASIGAMIIGEYAEGCAVILFYLLGELFENRAVRKSRNQIKELMDICPDEATVLIDGEEKTVDADEVGVGDTVIIRSGERIPVDCAVITGESLIDTSSMTGEARPISASVGTKLTSGCVVLDGVITARAEAVAEQSAAMRVSYLVEEATERKSKEESFITRFSKIYTPAVVVLAVLMATVPPLFSLLEWNDAIYRALSFLVISCPCALVISVPLAFFSGIGLCASHGILFKGSSYFSPISKVRTACFDKTGTLTKGEFAVTEVVALADIEKSELLRLAAVAEYSSTHPIADAIKREVELHDAPQDSRVVAGGGVVCEYKGHSIRVGNLDFINEPLSEKLSVSLDKTAVFVERDGHVLGYILLEDVIREEAREAIALLKSCGVSKTVMLTGDKREVAEQVGSLVGIDEIHAQLLPQDKYRIIESEVELNAGKVMYVGDGINDTPSLARADVGVSLGIRGTDSAKESADLVIMSDNLLKLPEAIKAAGKTLRIAKGNIFFAIGVKLLVLLLAAFGFVDMWLSVFADVGVAFICILNSMRLLLKKKSK